MTFAVAPVGMMPVASPRILFLLYSILLCAVVDLSLLLINLGLTSFFLGLVTATATIIHILTNLFIIYYHRRWNQYHQSEKHSQSHPLATSSQPTSAGWDWNLIPPTSKVSSIMMTLLLGALFVISSVITLLLNFIHYFGGGPNPNIEGDGSWLGQSTDPLKGPKAVLYADAAMELVCGILLVVLGVIGTFERRRFRTMWREIPSGASRVEA